jgi:hypothetical protein
MIKNSRIQLLFLNLCKITVKTQLRCSAEHRLDVVLPMATSRPFSHTTETHQAPVFFVSTAQSEGIQLGKFGLALNNIVAKVALTVVLLVALGIFTGVAFLRFQ